MRLPMICAVLVSALVRQTLVRHHASGSAVFRSRRASGMASAVHPSRPSAARARRHQNAKGLASSRKRPNASISGLGRTYRQLECATCCPSSHRWRRNPLGGHAAEAASDESWFYPTGNRANGRRAGNRRPLSSPPRADPPASNRPELRPHRRRSRCVAPARRCVLARQSAR